MRDIVVTIPKSTDVWQYQAELTEAEAGAMMNYKVSNFPQVDTNSRCYVVYDGFVRGWMQVAGLVTDDFVCSVTGNRWTGKFVQRTGKFHKVKPHPMNGFMGFRYVDRNLFQDVQVA